MTFARVSQVITETLSVGTPNARVSQVVAEVLSVGAPNARVSQVVAEVLSVGAPNARVSQLVTEVLSVGAPNARASQVIIEVLRTFSLIERRDMPPIYPSMVGLGYSTFWTPTFYNQSEQTSDGVNVDAALSAYPTHDFKLTYDFLRGQFQYGSLEFQRYMGFFLRMGGQAGRFLFLNPNDNYVQHQYLGTVVLDQAVYGPVQRTFGVGDDVGTEAVGWVDLTRPINIYLDGAMVDRSRYTFVQTIPANQQLKFFDTPAPGQIITGDFGYFYYCKFVDDKMTFEEFMRGLTLVKEVTLRSCKAGT